MTSTKWEGHARIIALSKDKEEKKHAEFNAEAQERRRARANKPFFPHSVYFNQQASRDGIKHFADGIGDTNPLFRDEEYARKTRYGRIIAPPSYLYTIMWVAPGSGGPGIHAWYVGGEWEWYRPIWVGDEFKVVCILRELEEKRGRMGGGRTWMDYTEVIYLNQREEIVGKERQHTVWGERGKAGATGKYRAIPKPTYNQEDWSRILDLYEQEERRGSRPRYWEDVQIGDKVGPLIKGPLSVRDEIAWLMGAGSPFFRAHRIQYEFERRHPRALEYVETEESDAPGDVPELVHILSPFARAIGVERAYDYGSQRMAWLGNLFTNWMGDDGFLGKMSGDERVFNLMGDITTFEGRVIRKYREGERCCVDIEAWAKNQRGEWSMVPCLSTVLLPSREYGAVVYPDPPTELAAEVKRARPLDDLIKEGLI